MILPIFLIGMCSVISVGLMMNFYTRMQCALYEEGMVLKDSLADGHNESAFTIEESVKAILDEYDNGYVLIENGRDGISLKGSRLDNAEYFELVAEYCFRPFGADLLGLIRIPVAQKCVMHIWCGYINGYFADGDTSYVYITKDSEVYHLSRECSHLLLSISTTSGDKVKELRNSNGAKYYSCNVCHSSDRDPVLYVTKEGNKYHNTVTCSGLKRTVRAIKLSSVGDRRVCKRCGR